MSSDLLWLLTRSNNSFLVKRNGVILSRESNNLTNKHSFKYSGLASAKTIQITPAAKGVVVGIKKTKTPAYKVKKSLQSSTIAKPARTTAKSVKAITKHYRPDLVSAALARAGRLLQGQETVKAQKAKKTRRSRV